MTVRPFAVTLGLIFAVTLLLPAARAQALPDNPAPAPLYSAWDRLKNLAIGAPIVVGNENGPPVHCLFAGVTDAYLYCNPPGNPAGVGFRFDRASVTSVDFDLSAQNSAQFNRPQRNYHPAWIASILAGGLIVGLCSTPTMNDSDSARTGAIGALVVAAIGAPLAFLPHPQNWDFSFRPKPFAGGPRIPLFGPHPRFVPRPARFR